MIPLYIIGAIALFWFAICYVGVMRAHRLYTEALALSITCRDMDRARRMYDNDIAFWAGAFGFVFIALMVVLAATWGFVK